VSAAIGRDAEFRKSEFNGNVSFYGAKIDGSAFFNEAKFLRQPEWERDLNVNFVGATIGRNAEFIRSTFNGNVGFGSATIGGNAEFIDCRFNGNVSFDSAKIDGNAKIIESTIFQREATFIGTSLGHDLYLGKTIFEEKVSFVNSDFKTIFFRI
jgi:hypothetical protein